MSSSWFGFRGGGPGAGARSTRLLTFDPYHDSTSPDPDENRGVENRSRPPVKKGVWTTVAMRGRGGYVRGSGPSARARSEPLLEEVRKHEVAHRILRLPLVARVLGGAGVVVRHAGARRRLVLRHRGQDHHARQQRWGGGTAAAWGGGGSSTTGIFIDSGPSDATFGVCVPKTCDGLGATCGPQGDGCGNLIQCGNCKAPETCGGAGVASVCGGNTGCTPKTCADWGADCGPVSDGCGGVVQCGTCNSPQSCGRRRHAQQVRRQHRVRPHDLRGQGRDLRAHRRRLRWPRPVWQLQLPPDLRRRRRRRRVRLRHGRRGRRRIDLRAQDLRPAQPRLRPRRRRLRRAPPVRHLRGAADLRRRRRGQ